MGGRLESDDVIMARFDERLNGISSDIGEIKKSISEINGNINRGIVPEVACTNTKLKDHLDQHKRDFAIFGVVITSITLVIDFLLRR